MRVWNRARSTLRAIMLRRRMEHEMQEEMAEHLRQASDRLMARGMPEREARLAARREFGSLGAVQEEARDAFGSRWVGSVVADIRYALRQYARTPLTTLTIVITLMIGIGVSSALFAFAQGIFLRPPAGIPDDPALVRIHGLGRAADGSSRERSFGIDEVLDHDSLESVFAGVAAWGIFAEDAAADFQEGSGATESVRAQFVTPNVFDVLGVRLAAGSGFIDRAADRAEPPELTAVISHTLALEQFGEIERALGTRVRVNGAELTVVGVAPARFYGPQRVGLRAIWIPISARQLVAPRGVSTSMALMRELNAAAVLAPGVSMRTATAAVRMVAARREAIASGSGSGSGREAGWEAQVTRWRTDDAMRGRGGRRGFDARTLGVASLTVLLTLVILLVCTTTVSSLLVGNAIGRRHEIGTRLALGGTRLRLVRQLLTETSILAVTGGILGISLYLAISRVLAAHLHDVDVRPDWATVVFTVLFAVLTAALCGLSPALHATRTGIMDVLKDSWMGVTARSRLQRMFVVTQIALTQPLLAVLALLLVTLLREVSSRPSSGVTDQVLELRFGFSAAQRGQAAFPQLIDQLRHLPGVLGVVPAPNGYGILDVVPVGAVNTSHPSPLAVRTQQVGVRHFSLLGLPILFGREFDVRDASAIPRRIVIGSDLARDIFGTANAVGRRFRALGGGGSAGELEVIGVVDAKRAGSSTVAGRERIYSPSPADCGRLAEGGGVPSSCGSGLLIRTIGPAAPMIPTVREILRRDAPGVPIRLLTTMAEQERSERSELYQLTGASAAGGVLALLLGSVGLYAVVALAVVERRKEIGLRVALGAGRRAVLGTLMQSGLRLAMLGVGIGLPLSVAALSVLANAMELPRVSKAALGASVAAAVISVAVLATWLPARKATAQEPITSLRVS